MAWAGMPKSSSNGRCRLLSHGGLYLRYLQTQRLAHGHLQNQEKGSGTVQSGRRRTTHGSSNMPSVRGILRPNLKRTPVEVRTQLQRKTTQENNDVGRKRLRDLWVFESLKMQNAFAFEAERPVLTATAATIAWTALVHHQEAAAIVRALALRLVHMYIRYLHTMDSGMVLKPLSGTVLASTGNDDPRRIRFIRQHINVPASM